VIESTWLRRDLDREASRWGEREGEKGLAGREEGQRLVVPRLPGIGRKVRRGGISLDWDCPVLALSSNAELLDLALGYGERFGCCAEVEQLGFG